MSATTTEKLYDRELIAEHISNLAGQVKHAIGDSELMVIAVLGGAVVFLTDLIREFEQPLSFGFIQVKYSKGSGREQAIHFPLPLDLQGHAVLILKGRGHHRGYRELSGRRDPTSWSEQGSLRRSYRPTQQASN